MFYSNVEDGATSDAELYNINPLTGAIDQLTFNNVDDRYPAWSPDYTQLTFSRRVGGASRDVFIHNLDNSEPLPLVTGDIWDWNSNWSADRALIAYVHGDPRDVEPSAIWAVRPDGTGAVRDRERRAIARPGLVAGRAEGGAHGGGGRR